MKDLTNNTNMNKHDKLFTQWKSERPEYESICDDGILIEDEWNKANPKIAFLLKESNDDFTAIRGAAHGPSGTSKSFWRNLRIWRYVLRCHILEEDADFETAKVEKEMPLSDVAYINLKKNAQSRSSSSDADILSYVGRDWELLNKQLININPDIIVCCGTLRYLKNVNLDLEHLGGRIYKLKDKLLVDFFHPSCRKSFQGMFDELKHDLSAIKMG